LQSQEDICRENIKKNGLEVAKIFKETFAGGSSKRKEILSLPKFIKRKTQGFENSK
jgi:hypothetical protein